MAVGLYGQTIGSAGCENSVEFRVRRALTNVWWWCQNSWRRPCHVGLIMDDTRPMDNMALAWNTPQEDEVAVNQLSSGVGERLPRRAASHLCRLCVVCVSLISFMFRLHESKSRSTDEDWNAAVHGGVYRAVDGKQPGRQERRLLQSG